MSLKRVLFLSSGNSARSQTAEAFLRRYAGDALEAHSAGLEPKGVNPLTLTLMNEIGIDITGSDRTKDQTMGGRAAGPCGLET